MRIEEIEAKEKAGEYLDPMEIPCILCGRENQAQVSADLSLCEGHEDSDVNARVSYLLAELKEAQEKLMAVEKVAAYAKTDDDTAEIGYELDRILQGGE